MKVMREEEFEGEERKGVEGGGRNTRNYRKEEWVGVLWELRPLVGPPRASIPRELPLDSNDAPV